jgi:hypothetical protein
MNAMKMVAATTHSHWKLPNFENFAPDFSHRLDDQHRMEWNEVLAIDLQTTSNVISDELSLPQ